MRLFEDTDKAFLRGDYKTVYRRNKPLAELGSAKTQAALCFLYYNGLGVPQDFTEAMKWCRKAADQGNAYGQCGLGFMYDEGRGVQRNLVLAHMWLNLGASRIPTLESERRNNAMKGRDKVADEMTPAQLAEAKRLEREWKPKMER